MTMPGYDGPPVHTGAPEPAHTAPPPPETPEAPATVQAADHQPPWRRRILAAAALALVAFVLFLCYVTVSRKVQEGLGPYPLGLLTPRMSPTLSAGAP